MYFRDGSVDLYGGGPDASFGAEQADGQHYGQQADGEHYAFRHVPVDGQPHGGLGDGGGLGRTDPHALHPRHRRSMDAWRKGDDRQYARIAQQLQMHMQLGWTDFRHYAWDYLPRSGKIKLITDNC